VTQAYCLICPVAYESRQIAVGFAIAADEIILRDASIIYDELYATFRIARIGAVYQARMFPRRFVPLEEFEADLQFVISHTLERRG
jgi:hypothetical protein